MSRFLLRSIKILHATQVCSRQWSRVFLYGLNSCLYENGRKSLRSASNSIEPGCELDVCCNNYAHVGINNENYTNFNLRRGFSSNAILYSLDEKEKQQKFSDKHLGDCEIHYRKDKHGEYKVMICKKGGDKRKYESRGGLPPDVNILKALGAVALTLVGIILAAYGAVFFMSIAANVIVLVATVLFFVISYRITKDWWIKGRGRR